MTQLLLIGNPNCGKTTLFNALTGEKQQVGNWPGVTVEKKTGTFKIANQHIDVMDLPGVYSLSVSENASQDVQITASTVAAAEFDLLIQVIDACQLERHLYLTSQLLELKKPLVIALNMLDVAEQRGIYIDNQALGQLLGCPVIAIQAHRNLGLIELQQAILTTTTSPTRGITLPIPEQLQSLAATLEQSLSSYAVRRLLEGDTVLLNEHHSPLQSELMQLHPDADILLADARYQMIHAWVQQVQTTKTAVKENLTAKIDRFALHRWFALPLFLSIIYAMFYLAIKGGGALQEYFAVSSETIFVHKFAVLLQYFATPTWLIRIATEGVGKGLSTTLTFIPVLAIMYFCLALLEVSGYMARVAFIVDRLMRMLGLPGKAFVPMIVGFGCNVPAVLAARILESKQDRYLTILMSPFMSCSARLAIYTVFVAAFFPHNGQNIVFSLYILGIIMAILTGVLFRHTLFKGQSSSLLLELPVYHWPSLARLGRETMTRLRFFLLRAGKLIIPICILLSVLNTIPWYWGHSLLMQIGSWLTPLFAPMGIQANNWPATVGLLTGMLAKEVVIGSLNSLYAQLGSAMNSGSHPADIMIQQFGGQAAAYAYLLFILLYIPCVSTMAAIRQETSRRLMWLAIIWSLLLAYVVAVLFYQIVTFFTHPQWVSGILFGIILALSILYWRTNRQKYHVASNP